MSISRKDEKGINKDHGKTVRKMTVRVECGKDKEQIITKVIKKEIKDVSN